MGEHFHTVTTDDGIRLAVTETGDSAAPLAVVLSHGLCLSQNSWSPQRRHLSQWWGDRVRVLTYDHRGHGNSDKPADHTALTINALGDDLHSVISALAPHTPTVIVGHSMGGMAVLAFAARHPEALGNIAAVGLISTAADHLASHGVGRALRGPAVPLLSAAARRSPAATQLVWHAIRRGVAPLLGVPMPPSAQLQCAHQIGATPIATIAAFLSEFRTHNQNAGLAALAHLPALVACGAADPVTPLAHSLTLVQNLPLATLLTIPGAGHLLGLERPHAVTDALIDLVGRTGLGPQNHRTDSARSPDHVTAIR